MKPVTMSEFEIAINAMIKTAIENEAYFSDLDGVVGDADFGTSIANGFREIEAQWDRLDRASIGHVLLSMSTIFASKVGGCSGPIWGTAFMRAGIVAKDKISLNADEISLMFERAIDGIKARGGAEEGDKTLLDALAPMARAFAVNAERAPMQAVLAAAEQAVEDTRALEARRGRQSFAGQRSVGTLDPGCVAVAMMTRRIAETVPQSA